MLLLSGIDDEANKTKFRWAFFIFPYASMLENIFIKLLTFVLVFTQFRTTLFGPTEFLFGKSFQF